MRTERRPNPCLARAATLLAAFPLLAPGCGGGGGGGGGGGVLFAYSSSALGSLRVGFPVLGASPSISFAATSYSITAGLLPPGLVLDPATGAVTGRPLLAGSYDVTVEVTDGTVVATTVIAMDVQSPPATRFAVVANRGDDTVSLLALDSSSELLVHENWTPTGDGPCAVAAAPDGGAIYIANELSGDVSAFELDTATGELNEIAGAPFAALPEPLDIAIDPTGRFAYVLCGDGGAPAVREYAVGFDGALTPLTFGGLAVGAKPERIVVEPLGRFAYVSFGGAVGMVQSYAINGTTGALVPGVAVMAGVSPRGMVTTSDGSLLFVANAGSGDISVFAIDQVTGALFSLGAGVLTQSAGPEDLTLSADGTILLVALSSGAVEAFSVASDGTLASQGTYPAPGASRVAMDQAGELAFALNSAGNELLPMTLAGGALAAAGAASQTLRADPTDVVLVPGLAPVSYVTAAVFAGGSLSGDITSFAVDPGDGSLAEIAGARALTTGALPNWAEVHPRLDVLYTVQASGFENAIEVFALDSGGSPLSKQLMTQNGFTAWSIHLDRAGRFAFGTNSSSGEVSGYAVLPDGMLQPAGPALDLGALATLGGGVVDRTGRFLYVTRSFNGLVHQLSIDPITGVLSDLASPTVTAGTTPLAMTVDPTGRFVYVACFGPPSEVRAFRIDPLTGELSELASSPFATTGAPVDLVASHDGRRLFVANTAVVPNLETFAIDGDSTNAVDDGSLASTNVQQLIAIPFQVRLGAAGDVLYVTRKVTSGGVETFALDDDGVPTPLDFDAAGDTTTSLAVRTVLQ